MEQSVEVCEPFQQNVQASIRYERTRDDNVHERAQVTPQNCHLCRQVKGNLIECWKTILDLRRKFTNSR
jgi:hypothetical protein